ncbi:MAG: ATP-dependent DNA helicase RecG [Synergistes sp.]|nr:ATP-dependent DNA helicase RecG [Synergistes sp.]
MKKENLCLSDKISVLRGVGTRRAALLCKLGIETVKDIIFFFPRRYEDRRSVKKIAELSEGTPSVVYGEVLSCETKPLSGKGRNITKCRLTDGSGTVCAVWFNRRGLDKTLTKGTKTALFGVVVFRSGLAEMTEPELEILKDTTASSFTGIIPVYPLTDGISQNQMRNIADTVITKYIPLIEENLPRWIITKNSLMPLNEALHEMHRPSSPEMWKIARKRIVYGEFFELQSQIAVLKAKRIAAQGIKILRGEIYDTFLNSLPFEMTPSQLRAADEILNDAAKGTPTARLLQGDVGSGKTLVAAAFAAAVCDSDAQCALLAPTEVLAEQLNEQMQRYLKKAGVKCGILKGNMSASERKKVLAEISERKISVICGTQALLSEGVEFARLGAVIIDEQQRFGVRQRMALLEKIPRPHLLMMSATPIPRTMAQTLFCDLDISVIEGMPSGRAGIETRVITYKSMASLMQFIIDECGSGGRIYWICPRVAEKETSDMASAEKRFEWLKKMLPPISISLIHGQMSDEEKNTALNSFRCGTSKILVGTTVLEVGIDVPEATVIVIESPEMYGLSQLHQLRGRVGRGKRRGVCVLLTAHNANLPRLVKFAAERDGFEIAKADLEERGAGEFIGTAQHGFAQFRIADIRTDITIAEAARDDAAKCTADILLSNRTKA